MNSCLNLCLRNCYQRFWILRSLLAAHSILSRNSKIVLLLSLDFNFPAANSALTSSQTLHEMSFNFLEYKLNFFLAMFSRKNKLSSRAHDTKQADSRKQNRHQKLFIRSRSHKGKSQTCTYFTEFKCVCEIKVNDLMAINFIYIFIQWSGVSTDGVKFCLELRSISLHSSIVDCTFKLEFVIVCGVTSYLIASIWRNTSGTQSTRFHDRTCAATIDLSSSFCLAI